MKNLKKLIINNNIYKIQKTFFGIGSFHSKYVIVGSGHSGYALSKFMTQV